VRADLRRWSGLGEPGPGTARSAAALAAILSMTVLTIVGAAPESLGQGFGRLFLVFAVIVGPATAGLLVLRPWSGLTAWAAMAPLLNVARLQTWIGPVQVTQSTIFVAALLAGVLLERTAPRVTASNEAPVVPEPWPVRATLVAAGLIGFPLLSLLASPAPGAGLPIVLHGVIEPVIVGLLVCALRPTPRQAIVLGAALVIGLALASVYSVARIGRISTSIAELEVMRVQLAHFTFYNVGIYGDALAMVIPIAAAWLLWRRPLGLGRVGTLVALAALVALLGGLYLTFSKSAWLGTWVALVAVLIARFQSPRTLALIAVGAAVSLTLIVPFPLYVLDALHLQSTPYQQLLTKVQGSRLSSWDVGSPEGEVSIGERWRATQAALRMTVDHPLLGVGPGRFGDEYAGRYADAGATRKLGSPHDLMPEVAAELGLPAAVLLTLAFLAALWSAWRAIRGPDGILRATGAAFGSALIAFLVVTAAFGLDLYRDYRVMNSDVIMGALIVGVCISLARWIRPPAPEAADPTGG
ncbi:MAG TPA: O-antigen ligase family protein, partial [Candidatus Dormibacteraeota bacterium]|nr:O-antigen ligase family protein [Candidatus Dormibacteraeota bacterium]